MLLKDYFDYQESNSSSKELIIDVFKEANNEDDIDWNKLEEINQDIVGWIKIKNTNINYPILKDNNDLYYLKHSFDKKSNHNGAIFTVNNNPFEDKETVIYGHNMKSGLMFSDLAKYMNAEFFYEHYIFDIYTKAQNYRATVFSSYSVSINQEENSIMHLDFKEQVEYYKNKSKFSVGDIGEIKKILKLSTCSYIGNHTVPTDQRFYIVAKLEKIKKS